MRGRPIRRTMRRLWRVEEKTTKEDKNKVLEGMRESP
jgi:hypothetical protein